MNCQLRKILLIELFVLIFAGVSLLCNYNNYVFTFILVLLAVLINFFIKVDGRNSRFDKEYILLIIIAVLSYYIIEYFLGFIVGFIYSTYSRRILGIIKNIVIAIFFIFSVENLREKIIKGGKYYKVVIVISVLIFTLIELVGIFNLDVLTSKRLVMQFVLSVFIPIFFKNIMLTIICYYSNKNITILYQLLMTLPNYILGVFPDLGDYVNTSFQTILPLTISFFVLKIKDVKREKITNGRVLVKRKRLAVIIGTISVQFSLLLIYLVSGLGKYYIMAIGSESMTGTINKGDAVIVHKKSRDYKKGYVIAFKVEGKVIVHRIVKIEITEKGTFYKTKGDYNKSEDGWMLTEEDIIGRCAIKIPVIGWPSVVLSEFISR